MNKRIKLFLFKSTLPIGALAILAVYAMGFTWAFGWNPYAVSGVALIMFVPGLVIMLSVLAARDPHLRLEMNAQKCVCNM